MNEMMEYGEYAEPRCVLCSDPDGRMPEDRRIPQKRVAFKLDEYMARRDYEGAERHLLYWMAEAELLGDLEGRLMLCNELAGHYRKTGNREGAIARAEEALSLVDALDFTGSISAATSCVNAATVMNAFGEDERALQLFEKARGVYEALPRTDKALLGGLYNNMALALVSLARFEEASGLYEKALSVMGTIPGGKLEQAITYLNMADMYEKWKGAEQAEGDIYACLDRAEALLADGDGAEDGYYAFVLEKCAPTFAYYGWFMAAEEYKKKAEVLYARA